MSGRRFRTGLRWALTIITAAIAVIYVANAWFILDLMCWSGLTGRQSPEGEPWRSVAIEGGTVCFSWRRYPLTTVGAKPLELSVRQVQEPRWWLWFPNYDPHRGASFVFIPLWMPLLLVGALGFVAWNREAAGRIAERQGKCPGCRYDVSGLRLNAACPECGKASAT